MGVHTTCAATAALSPATALATAEAVVSETPNWMVAVPTGGHVEGAGGDGAGEGRGEATVKAKEALPAEDGGRGGAGGGWRGVTDLEAGFEDDRRVESGGDGGEEGSAKDEEARLVQHLPIDFSRQVELRHLLPLRLCRSRRHLRVLRRRRLKLWPRTYVYNLSSISTTNTKQKESNPNLVQSSLKGRGLG
ncbi:hypothetical protein C4D60_Mb08t23040 [Musa balbisiana]|uniref:Uncharacterized protein n=1 Tax=Musa balbisiana TaxID=52838 RepID=A0A4S8K5V2_MUSBA|nr:hypothetical protein C4D60_Mb08t23040 [Musa balbisiana]